MAIVANNTTKISIGANGQGDQYSFGPFFSADGTKVLFYSYATNLVSGDANGKLDIFVKDLTSGTITRASTSVAGVEGNGDSLQPVFSPDGNMVAFSSNASNLVAGDTNAMKDIFVKNILTGEITRVSTNSAGQQANGHSEDVSFSADGTRVAFSSKASNLVGGDTPNTYDIFVKTLATGSIIRLTSGANDSSGQPIFSPDGNKVIFHSSANNLVSGDTNDSGDIFIRNIASATTTRISTNSSGVQVDGESFDASISADGTKVLFSSDATNLVDSDNNDATDVFVKDLTTGTVTRISTNSLGEEGNGAAFEAVFSPDGTKVAFRSNATNLVEGDTNSTDDLFIKDLVTGEVSRVSTGVGGAEANDISGGITFSADGSKISYWSWATNLTADGSNGAPQIYVASLGTGSGGGGSSLAPISAPDTAAATENTVTGNLIPSMISNDSDPSPSDTITVTAVDSSGTLGTLSFDAGAQSLTYLAGSAFDDLSTGATRNDSFAYTITDSTGLTSTNTVTVTVTGVNDAPVNTVTAGYTTEEDVTLNVSGLSITEIDTLDTLSVTLQVSQGSLYVIGTVAGGLTAGQITGNSSGNVTLTGSTAAINATLAHGNGVSYTAPANFNGQSTLTMTTSDGTASDSDTATITITPTNDAPIAQSDSYAVAEDGTLIIGGAAGVLANDADSVDSPANGLTATLVSGVTHGTLTLNADGSFTYTPNADYNGTDSFSYRAVDDGTPNLQSEVVTVNLGVTAVNDAPVNTLPLAYNTAEDTSVVLNGMSVTDIDGADTILTVTLGVAQGTLTVTDGISGGLEASAISGNNTGSVTLTGTAAAINTTLANSAGVNFNPPANMHGDITFTLTTTDGVETDTDTAVIAVLSVNDAPVAQAESYIATEDTPLVVSAGTGVLVNDADVNDTPPDTLSAVLITGTTNGTLTLNADGSFTYNARLC